MGRDLRRHREQRDRQREVELNVSVEASGAVEAFGIEKEFLRSLLTEAASGRAQLPEFQRGWVWPMENIRGLLASISLGYPVGTIMMLRTGGVVRFKERLIEGANPDPHRVERLILDGQQRLTSLFQALLLTEPINTQDARKRKLSGWFYVGMKAALDDSADREEAFSFVPADRIVRTFRGDVATDLSTPELEYAASMFPLGQIFEPDEWLDSYVEYWDFDKERQKLRTDFRRTVLRQFDQYQVPVIELGSATPRQAVCQVFEKVNTGGVTLTVFELLTATYAADEFDLRRDWLAQRKAWSSQTYRVLHEVTNTDFLQAVTLLATNHARNNYLVSNVEDERAPRVGCRRADILNLPLAAYQRWAPAATEGFKSAARLLHQQYMFDTRYLPYGSQLIPLAAILTILGNETTTVAAHQKLSRWLWCGVFGELYGGTTETRFARDVPEVVAWIRGSGVEPRTVQESQFAPGRLDTLRTRGSAAYKGIYALLMKSAAVDWRSGEPVSVTSYFDEAVDIHHIFPRVWCEREGIPDSVYNSIVNKTPLTARTNRVIGGWAPSVYLPRLANSAGVTESVIEANVSTHVVNPSLLQADDFTAFMNDRRFALLRLVGEAMGRPIETTLTEDVDEPAGSEEDLEDE